METCNGTMRNDDEFEQDEQNREHLPEEAGASHIEAEPTRRSPRDGQLE